MNKKTEETATMPFSEQVKWVRGELLLTQAEMAKEIGITPSTLSRWENTSREPSFLGKKQFALFCKKRGIQLGGGEQEDK